MHKKWKPRYLDGQRTAAVEEVVTAAVPVNTRTRGVTAPSDARRGGWRKARRRRKKNTKRSIRASTRKRNARGEMTVGRRVRKTHLPDLWWNLAKPQGVFLE